MRTNTFTTEDTEGAEEQERRGLEAVEFAFPIGSPSSENSASSVVKVRVVSFEVTP